jgi:hypothetical protein
MNAIKVYREGVSDEGPWVTVEFSDGKRITGYWADPWFQAQLEAGGWYGDDPS